MKTKSKDKTLSQRITSYLKELKTEALGMEKRVNENIHRFFLESGNKHRRPAHELLVKIQHPNNSLHIQLFHRSELLAILKSFELVNFFSGGMSAIPGLEEKTVEKVISYFNYLSHQHGISPHQLDIVIINCTKLVVVEVVSGTDFRKQIQLKELIQFFQK